MLGINHLESHSPALIQVEEVNVNTVFILTSWRFASLTAMATCRVPPHQACQLGKVGDSGF